MNTQAIVMLLITILILGSTIALGIKQGVFARWWQTFLSWDWYTRIAMLAIALASAAILTWGIH